MDSSDFKRYGITPDPLLGQNFLVDRKLIEEEVGLLALTREDAA